MCDFSVKIPESLDNEIKKRYHIYWASIYGIQKRCKASPDAAGTASDAAGSRSCRGEKRAAVEEYLRIKAWRAGLPRYGKFELTPLCNLDCKMCYIHLQKEQMEGKELLPVEAWKQLMTQAA